MAEINSDQEYNGSQVLYYRKNGQIFSGKYRFVRRIKDHVTDAQGKIMLNQFINTEYFIDGYWYKEQDLKLSALELL